MVCFLVATLVSLAGMAYAAPVAVDSVNSVLTCDGNIYADGHIYRSSGSGLGGLDVDTSFPLHLAVASHGRDPLDPVMPAQQTGPHQYAALDQYLYINASTGAHDPVAFVANSNATLGLGETTWGFYSPYGVLLWLQPTTVSVHIQGFQWVPVDGAPDVTQLYWNQTQYDLAAAGKTAGIDASHASFGACSGDTSPKVVSA